MTIYVLADNVGDSYLAGYRERPDVIITPKTLFYFVGRVLQPDDELIDIRNSDYVWDAKAYSWKEDWGVDAISTYRLELNKLISRLLAVSSCVPKGFESWVDWRK